MIGARDQKTIFWRLQVSRLISLSLIFFSTVLPAGAEEGIWFSTSKFYLSIKDPCEVPGQDGPDWCRRAIFRLVRKKDCREFRPRGHADIGYCMGDIPNTPCQDLGWTFYFKGSTYYIDSSYPERVIAAYNPKTKSSWSETTKFFVTKSSNPSFRRTVNGCVLPASEVQR